MVCYIAPFDLNPNENRHANPGMVPLAALPCVVDVRVSLQFHFQKIMYKRAMKAPNMNTEERATLAKNAFHEDDGG